LTLRKKIENAISTGEITPHLFFRFLHRAFCGAVAVVFCERSFEMLVCMIESRDSMTAM
jgi:hypothetical protein